ncbi:type II toxin-antitoxin system HipA family toxin [Pseudomonas protegens]|uniref:type II toxin-antitoxin system HipA family toxin n=1 Tax=Pseudomonas protegens TaxID=380021 RepID=UPI001C8E0EFA|nr:type II toxin-antitoxin system HipA family toxin [Pseudomonas protegens]QZI70526.1 type II toxin-antitoxin system HipA family toxin [Pseudomonas protegens]
MTEQQRLHIRVASMAVGTLGLGQAQADSVFTYSDNTSPGDAVSLTMPPRLASYGWDRGLPPVFDMHRPEGSLRDELLRRFSKAVRGFNDFALLSIVGPHQLGRVAISTTQSPQAPLPETSLEDLLVNDGAEGLFEDLLATYGQYSGVSGVQPKVLIRDSTNSVERLTHGGATHLVKAFRADQYPHLAANEFFCMRAALHAGLPVPEIELSQNGQFLVVKRFDLNTQGYLGFEDFCVLNAWPAKAKYDGSYEGAAKQIKAFVSPHLLNRALESFFKIVALSAGLRNGDAHLKNFGVLYPDTEVEAPVSLAPAFDLVTTSVYIKADSLALLLGGSKAWPKRQALLRFARTACNLSEGRSHELLQQVEHGMAQAMGEMQIYSAARPAFKGMAEAMSEAWKTGVARSLTR